MKRSFLKKNVNGLVAGTLAAIVVLFPLTALAQTGAKGGQWRTYGGDTANTRYSALDQINAGNFNKLEIAWRFKTDNLGPRPEYNLEGTPLMVNGTIFATAGTRRAVVALNAATGELLWMHSEIEGERGTTAPRRLSGRGLAYWTDGREERIFYVTPGYRLVGLDAKTGALVQGFGKNGLIDLKEDDDQTIDPIRSDIGLHTAPVIGNDVIIIGAAHGSGATPRTKTNVKGYVRGFDVRTGKRLWIFHTIPRPGEFGYDTWQDDSADYTGNTGSWAQMSVDEQLGLAYLPVELPTGDYYGGHRPGNGLFGESIVAVDLKTGVRKWHYQLVHHGLWDFDIPCAPILVDITVNDRPVKALAQPTKQAFLYMFDRVTGQPIFPIEERPVEQSTVPNEKSSPTQPYPTKPPPYDRQGFALTDLIDFTPELNAQAREKISHYKLGPVFTPPVVSKRDGPLGVLTLGGSGGGTVWAGGSVDVETGVAYVYSRKQLVNLSLIATDPKEREFAYIRGVAGSDPRSKDFDDDALRAASLTVQGLPMYKPPYGQITAIDLNKGEILWQVPHGETPDAVRNNPALKGVRIPRTGRDGIIGTLVTKTLVIAGEAGVNTMPDGKKGAYLRAYDKATGKDAGIVPMPAGQTGSPMTYMFNNRQYIVVAVGAAGFPGEYIAYRLP